MPITTYQQALDFWYSRVNYEQRGMPADLADLKLDRMRSLLAKLGDPHERLRIIHIAGSKGKGSTAAMIAAVLERAGYRTGLFTSPHLCRVEERCQVNGQSISPGELTTIIGEIEPAVQALESREQMTPTFFEVGTALGFLHFVRRRVEWAVVEVGLGGRFDSTNVCTPEVAVVTSISFDHTQQLGNELASIAREKAGIIKPGKPVVSGVAAPEAREVIAAIAAERQAPLFEIGRHFTYRYEPGWIADDSHKAPKAYVTTPRKVQLECELSLLGEHQAANASVAVACIDRLQSSGVRIPDDAIRDGLRQVRWPARMEVMSTRPLIILDCAHNLASIQALIDTLQTTFPPSRRLLLFAISRDKDVAGILQLLAPHFQRAFFTTYTASARSIPASELAKLWQQAGGRDGTVHANPAEAWKSAQAETRQEELLCITGSVFLAGEVRPLIEHDLASLPVRRGLA